MINALGFVEILGLTAGIEASDAMLKSADVRLLNYEVLVPGLVTVVVEGDLAACRAAVDAGAAAAGRIGTVVSRNVIGRPDADTEWLVLGLGGVRVRAPAAQPSTPAAAVAVDEGGVETPAPLPASGPEAPAPVGESTADPATIAGSANVPAVSDEPPDTAARAESPLFALLEQYPQGVTIGEAATHLHTDTTESRQILDRLVQTGKLRKRGSRYRIRHQGG